MNSIHASRLCGARHIFDEHPSPEYKFAQRRREVNVRDRERVSEAFEFAVSIVCVS